MSAAHKVIKYLAIALAVSIIISIFTGVYYALNSVANIYINPAEKGLNIDKFSDDAKILSVSLGASKLEITQGEKLDVKSSNEYIKSKKENNKLAITEKKHSIFKNDINEEVTIYIPEDMIFDKVYIFSGAGTINIDNISAQDLELELGAGKIEIDKLTTYKTTDIKGGAGEVTISNAKLNNLDLEAGVGKFTLSGSIIGKGEIEAGIGELNLNLTDAKDNYQICAKKGIGSLKIDDKHYSDEINYGSGNNKLDISGGIGSININFLGR